MAKETKEFFTGATATATGMLYNGFECDAIVEQCEGCERAHEFDGKKYCISYPAPASKWSMGRCNFATHVKAEVKAHAKVNPLKASKRASKGK